LFQVVYNVTVDHDGETLTYEKLCAHWNTYCYDNDILRLADIVPTIVAGELNITYPIFFNPFNFEVSDASSMQNILWPNVLISQANSQINNAYQHCFDFHKNLILWRDSNPGLLFLRQSCMCICT
jgi:hypothetical protein